MAEYTDNLKLGKPLTSEEGWGATCNTTFETIDQLAPVGGGCVTPNEVPSASRQVAVAPCEALRPDGTVGAYAGGNPTLNANTTSYLYLNTALALNVSTSGWPAAPHYRLAIADTDGSTVTAILDRRRPLPPAAAPPLLLAGGTLDDGADVAVGAATGTKIGTNTTQKLGFFGAAPVARPSVPSATATNTWTSTERQMLQALHDAFRSLGLGG